MKLIAFVGFQGSGKDTAGRYLANSYGFRKFSFADGIKDSLSSIFCWPRDLLEGDSDESREWRETVDSWWAEKLGIPNFTPRWAMRNFGTELMRNQFNREIWVMNIERKITLLKENEKIVVTDGRYPNEIQLIRKYGGTAVWVKRGDNPEWFDIARQANNGDFDALNQMDQVYKIHESEWAWIGQNFDETILNDGTKEQLHERVVKLII